MACLMFFLLGYTASDSSGSLRAFDYVSTPK